MPRFDRFVHAVNKSGRLGACLAAILGVWSPAFQAQPVAALVPMTPARPAAPPSPAAYGRLAVSFEPNLGQADPRVKFLSRQRTDLVSDVDEAVAVLRRSSSGDKARGVVLRMQLLGANRRARDGGGRDIRSPQLPDRGRPQNGGPTFRPTARSATARSTPGIDAVFYGSGRSLKYKTS